MILLLVVLTQTTDDAAKLANKKKESGCPFDKTNVAFYQNKDVAFVKLTSGLAFSLSAICFVTATAMAHDKLPRGLVSSLGGQWPQLEVPEMSVYSHAVYAASSLVYTLYTAWDLRALGFVRAPVAVAAGLISVASSFFIGPVATFSAIRYWREGVVSGLSTMSS